MTHEGNKSDGNIGEQKDIGDDGGNKDDRGNGGDWDDQPSTMPLAHVWHLPFFTSFITFCIFIFRVFFPHLFCNFLGSAGISRVLLFFKCID